MASMYKQWCKKAYEITTQQEYDEFWNWYLPIEKDIYDKLLTNKDKTYEGTLTALSETLKVEPLTLIGFIDGINSSLKQPYDMDNLDENSQIKFDIDHEKLYYNMLEATAQWLYELPAWDNILSPEKREQITKEYKKNKTVIKPKKVGRNDPCPCGSGLKYKKCHGKNVSE